MKYLVGTDIGTSGTKTIIMDTNGRLIAQNLQEYDVLTPKPLWAEQWPQLWLEAAERSIYETIAAADINSKDIAGVCISGLYGGSGIPLDAEMKPVRPCLIWMDRRAGEQEKWVKSNIAPEKLRHITRNGTDPYYGYTKIMWIRDNEPENWERTKLFLPPNSYVIYHLTGEVAIDYSSAGNIGGLFDMNTRSWSYELMDEMGIPRSLMPERFVENTEKVGEITEAASKRTGLPVGTPVFNGGVDCGAATLGMGVFGAGEYAVAIGTSMCAAVISPDAAATDALIEWPYVYDAKHLNYCFGGGATAGAAIKWFRDTFAEAELSAERTGGENAYAALDRLAEKIPCGSEGLVVLPYLMGERSPVWDTKAKGMIFGLSLIHTRAHIYRAFLEAIAYSLRHTMESYGTITERRVLLAGGVSKSLLWRQIFADVLGLSVVCPKNEVEANLGDVMLAGLGTATVTLEELKQWQMLGAELAPNPEAHAKYDEYYKIYRRIYEHTRGDMAALDAINQPN